MRRPYNLGTIQDFQYLANFPTLFKNPTTRKEGLSWVSGIKSFLATYIQIIDDLLINDNNLKNFGKSNKTDKNQLKKLKMDKAKIIEIIFLGIYVSSLILLIEPKTLIYGLIMNIITVGIILVISFISE